MSSWEEYIAQLEQNGCYKAAIASHEGRLWAQTKGFKVHGSEVRKLAKAMTAARMSSLYENGFEVGERSYAFIQGELDVDDADDLTWLLGRHKARGKMVEAMIVCSMDTAVLMALHNPAFTTKSFGTTFVHVTQMAQQLRQLGT